MVVVVVKRFSLKFLAECARPEARRPGVANHLLEKFGARNAICLEDFHARETRKRSAAFVTTSTRVRNIYTRHLLRKWQRRSEGQTTIRMTDKEEGKKLSRNPSGIPPLPYDSEEDSDQGEPSYSSACLTTVVEGENDILDASRDPPAVEKPLSDDVNDVGDAVIENDDDGEAVVDDHHGPETSSAALPTTDEQAPRGTHEPITRGVPRPCTRSDDLSSLNDSSALPPSRDESSSSQQGTRSLSVQMPPNIIKAALQKEVHDDQGAPEIDADQDLAQVSSEDEKKSEDKSDSDLTPPPEKCTNGNIYRMPRSDLETAAALGRVNSTPPFSEPFHMQEPMPYGYAMAPVPSPYIARAPLTGGRRKIILHLEEDAQPSHVRRPSFFFRHRRDDSLVSIQPVAEHGIDRGSIAVSWFEGTTSAELQEHVRRSLIRKMGLKGNVKLADLRIIDETTDPPEGKSAHHSLDWNDETVCRMIYLTKTFFCDFLF